MKCYSLLVVIKVCSSSENCAVSCSLSCFDAVGLASLKAIDLQRPGLIISVARVNVSVTVRNIDSDLTLTLPPTLTLTLNPIFPTFASTISHLQLEVNIQQVGSNFKDVCDFV